MKRLFCTFIILTAFFIMVNAVHAYFFQIDSTAGHYLVIDGSGTNVLMICGGAPAGVPPRGRGLSKVGLGLKL